MQRLDRILAHKAAPKVPEWPSYGNFRQVTQTRIFWKSAKGEPKNAQEVAIVWKAQKHSSTNGIIL